MGRLAKAVEVAADQIKSAAIDDQIRSRGEVWNPVVGAAEFAPENGRAVTVAVVMEGSRRITHSQRFAGIQPGLPVTHSTELRDLVRQWRAHLATQITIHPNDVDLQLAHQGRDKTGDFEMAIDRLTLATYSHLTTALRRKAGLTMGARREADEG